MSSSNVNARKRTAELWRGGVALVTFSFRLRRFYGTLHGMVSSFKFWLPGFLPKPIAELETQTWDFELSSSTMPATAMGCWGEDSNPIEAESLAPPN